MFSFWLICLYSKFYFCDCILSAFSASWKSLSRINVLVQPKTSNSSHSDWNISNDCCFFRLNTLLKVFQAPHSMTSKHKDVHMVYMVWDPGLVPMLPLNTAACLGRPRPGALSLPDDYLHANVCWEKRSVSPVKFSLFAPMNRFQSAFSAHWQVSIPERMWTEETRLLTQCWSVTELTLVHCSMFALHLCFWACACSYLISPLPGTV